MPDLFNGRPRKVRRAEHGMEAIILEAVVYRPGDLFDDVLRVGRALVAARLGGKQYRVVPGQASAISPLNTVVMPFESPASM